MDPYSKDELLTHHSGGMHGDVEPPVWISLLAGCREELGGGLWWWPRSRVDDDGPDGTFRGNMIRYLWFSADKVYMGEGATSVKAFGPHTTWRCAEGDLCHHMVWWLRGPPPTLVWTMCRVGGNRDLAICFVQFREQFLNNFSETKNSRKQATRTVASC